MSLLRYPEYRESGIAWAEELPSHWGNASLKWLCNRYSGGTPDKNRVDFWEDGTIPWLNSGAVNDGRIYEPSAYITQEAFERSSAKWIPAGALLVALAGQGKTKGMVAQLMFESTCNQSMAAIVPGGEINSRFLYWWLACNYQNIRNMAGGDLRDGLNLELLGEITCPLPLDAEQASIADFLDRETAKIDALIAEQEKLLALLAEKRQATISHAVTRSLNPDAPLKDSGIPCLGQVPAHWEVRRLRHAVPAVTVGIVVEPSKHYVDEGVPALRSLNVSPGQVRTEGLVFISDESNELLSKSKLRSGDVVVVRSGQAGAAAVVPPELDGCNCIDLIIIRKPLAGCERFLCWYLASDAATYQFEGGSEGAIQKHFNIGTAMNLVLPWPKAEEQTRIADYLDAKVSEIDGLTDRVSDAIGLLKERRGALIAAAVTGQIDVRGTVEAQAA